jgi:azurin
MEILMRRYFLLPWLWVFALAFEARASDTVVIELSTKGNDIAFDQAAVQIKFKKTIGLKFVNKAAADSHIGHNIAILKPDATDAVIQDLRKNNYDLAAIKNHPGILIISKTLNPGESDVVTFSPDKPGFYPYLCLMPGHSDILGMKGILHISE